VTTTRAAPPLSEILARGRVRAALSLLGPAFVAAVAYVDPGNFATNFAAGAGHGYELVWVVVLADLMAMQVQWTTSKLGVATGQDLPQLCGDRFSRRLDLALWVQAELVAMATDLAEFVGAALGLNLLFGIPLFTAGLVTAVVAFGVLELQRRGYRPFELAILALVGLVAAGFLVDLLAIGGQSGSGFAAGLVPRLSGHGTTGLAVGIIGATVMPHVVYLHSALQAARTGAVGGSERRTLLRFNLGDVIAGLGLAGLVNLAMVCVAAAVFHRPGLRHVTDLAVIHSDLGHLVGGVSALGFAVALTASGISSSSVGTFAGQVVMSGFTGWRLSLWIRRLVTMLPSLVVLAVGANTSSVLVLSQILLSFGIPFALVPLILITRDRRVMGSMVNRPVTTVALTGIAVAVTGLDAYLLAGTFFG
jgi:manganese transport protein